VTARRCDSQRGLPGVRIRDRGARFLLWLTSGWISSESGADTAMLWGFVAFCGVVFAPKRVNQYSAASPVCGAGCRVVAYLLMRNSNGLVGDVYPGAGMGRDTGGSSPGRWLG